MTPWKPPRASQANSNARYAVSQRERKITEMRRDIQALVNQLEYAEHERDSKLINDIAKKYKIRRIFE